LNQAYQTVVFKDKYKYYNFNSSWSYEIKLDDSSWDRIQMVSVDNKDNIRGYLSASIARMANKIDSIGAINFYDVNVTFAKDFYQFLTQLFEVHNFNKIEWTVVIGNPAEKLYDKIVNKFGGSVVGIRHESTRLYDGTICDVKDYEILKRDYERHKNEKENKMSH
jgi:hypothetical protein